MQLRFGADKADAVKAGPSLASFSLTSQHPQMGWICRRVVYPLNIRAGSTSYLATCILHFKFSSQHATEGAQNSKKAAGRNKSDPCS